MSIYGRNLLKSLDKWIGDNNSTNPRNARPAEEKLEIFLGGDWAFMNEFLGILSPLSRFNCFICRREHSSKNKIQKESVFNIPNRRNIGNHTRDVANMKRAFKYKDVTKGFDEKYRSELEYASKAGKYFHCAVRKPLLPNIFEENHLVPLPLHVFLGLGNSILSDIEDALWKDMDIARSERKLENSPDAVKAFHSLIYKREYRQRSAVTTGAKKVSAALAFNGEELRKMFSDNVVDERGSTWPIMQVIADIEIHSISVEELGA